MESGNPYERPQAVVADVAQMDLAGRGERLLAAIIDGLLLMALMLPLMFVGGYWQAGMEAGMRGESVPFGLQLMWLAIGFGVFALVQGIPLSRTGQTWGKRLLGIKIVDLDGEKPQLGRLLALRYLPVQLATGIPFIGGLIGVVNVLLIFRGDRRCGHDLIAGTQVVKAR